MADEIKLWRSTIFILFSLVFLLAVIIIISSNALAIFNYKPSSILLVYTFVNTYIIYLQYMYSITREELDKINQGTFEI
jgi:membrane protein YdbS with pleckstrin-like domain